MCTTHFLSKRSKLGHPNGLWDLDICGCFSSMAERRRHAYIFLCSVDRGIGAAGPSGPRPPPAHGPLAVALMMRRTPQLRHFEGSCFMCHAVHHSQNYCWLRQCQHCGFWGHSESVCLLVAQSSTPQPSPPINPQRSQVWGWRNNGIGVPMPPLLPPPPPQQPRS